MRVLLAHPPLNVAGEVSPPLGLCTLAAWLVSKGHEVRILDLDLEVKGLPDAQESYRKIFTRELRNFSPAAVGITSMYNNSLQAERIARAVKECDESVVTIGGGSHFGALGREALRRIPELDFAIEGEGEHTFSDLLTAIASGFSVTKIPRLHYRVQGELRANPSAGLMDLSELPPIWSTLGEAIDLKRYADTVAAGSPRRAIYIEAGRGCPFACTFCATAPFWERKYRVKPVDAIIGEMRFLSETYGYNAFMLVHDLLTVDKKFINNFSEAMMESRLPVEWMANHRTDINLHGLLPKMKSSGCWAMFFGIESASARLQKEMHKGLKRDGVVSTIRGLSDLGIASTCSFVIGFPDETPEELSATVAMGAELKLIGAGLVQYHRLRTWPPAPLSRKGLPAKFDVDSLRIEYPFLNVPREDVMAIKEDPEFFAGYFAPYSTAGTFGQLAQVELFFTQAVTVVPLTIAVMGRIMGDGLIPSFYDVILRRGPITREEFEADTSSVLPAWRLLRPYLEDWIKAYSENGHSNGVNGSTDVGWSSNGGNGTRRRLEDWQRQLIEGVMEYESRRLMFMNRDTVEVDESDQKHEAGDLGIAGGAPLNTEPGAVATALTADNLTLNTEPGAVATILTADNLTLNTEPGAIATALTTDNLMLGGENWEAYISKVDIGAVFEAMQTDQPLGPELVNELAVVLVRHDLNSYQAYTTEVSRIPDLPNLPFLLTTSSLSAQAGD